MGAPGGGPSDSLLGESNKLEVPEYAVYLVFLTIFIDTLAGSISTPVMPYYAKTFGVSTAAIGWLYGAWSFSSTAFAPGLSQIADRWGRRPVLVVSLVGAGVANVIQGLAPNFGVFLFGRFFSGVWAAVGSVCNVYVADVAPESIRADYLSKMSMVPMFALLFGPGLGGGLAKLGLNVPIMLDGCLTLFSACIIAYYLPETPAFLRSGMVSAHAEEDGQAPQPAASPTVPAVVHVLGVSYFLGGVAFSTLLSMFAIFMSQRFDFDTLRVGFSFASSSLFMMATTVWFIPLGRRRLSLTQCAAFGGLVNGVCLICFAFSRSVPVALAWFLLSAIGNGFRMGCSSAVVSSFTETSNRGKIFGLVQVYTNCGRMVGPILATHLAEWGVGIPFVLGGLANVLASCILLPTERVGHGPPAASAKLRKAETKFGVEWEDEVGSADDREALGRFMAELLTTRHYKWISRRAGVEELISQLLPELDTSHRTAYEESLQLPNKWY